MPTGIFDICDRAPVFHPDEIAAGQKQCETAGQQCCDGCARGKAGLYVAMLTKRWQRAVKTGQVIDAIRAGYCTIQPNGAPPASRATH